MEGRKIRRGEKHRTETARGVPSPPTAPHRIVGGEIEMNAGESVSGSSLSQGTFPSPGSGTVRGTGGAAASRAAQESAGPQFHHP